MSYKALYNKYRPTTFEEVAGQRSIVRTLKNAIAAGKIGHAYLFCGPRGTGKTSMARLFAKALNCESGVGDQCNECSNCVAINEGNHPDVIEIDAASNNGVDQVRDLVEKVRYAPIKGRYKIYIIDEVHMMTQGAFNALLKTLEEPPEQVIFILATTEPYKVLPTILSRCQRFDFGKIDREDIKEKLCWILNKEFINYDDRGLDSVVSLADGGMRDALSILDQVLAYSGESFSEHDVLTLFGLTSNAEKIELIKLLAQGDVSGVLAKLELFITGGIDIKRLCDNLLEILKDTIIYEKTHEETLLTAINEMEAMELEKVVPSALANKMISVLLKAQIDFKNVSNIRSLFELTLLQLCSIGDESPVEVAPRAVVRPTPAKVVEAPQPAAPAPQAAPATKPEPQPVSEPVAPIKPTIEPSLLETSSLPDEGEGYSLDDDTIVNIMVLGSNHKTERYELTQKWADLELLKAHPTAGPLAALLTQGHPFCVCEEAVLLTYDRTRAKEKANIKSNAQAIAKVISHLLGRQVFVYSLDRIDCNKYMRDYSNLAQLNKLPKKEEITLNLPEGK